MGEEYPQIPGVIAEVFVDGTLGDPRLDHAECVAAHSDGSLWCGGERGQIYRIADGVIDEVGSTGGFCLGIAFDHQDNLFICDIGHRAVMRMDAMTGRIDTFADGVAGHRLVNPNYIAFDRSGRMYVSDSGVRRTPGPGILRFDRNGSGHLWHPGPFDFANGIALAPDGSALYVVESWAHLVSSVEIEPDGSPGERRWVATLGGVIPDGIAFDAEGRLYIGCYEPSQVLRVEPDGTVRTVLADPTAHLLCHPTNLAFHGGTLYAANLGRWHLTAIEIPDTAGEPRRGAG